MGSCTVFSPYYSTRNRRDEEGRAGKEMQARRSGNDRHRGKRSRLNDGVRGVKEEERRLGICLQLNE